jgi:hypothetical protein
MNIEHEWFVVKYKIHGQFFLWRCSPTRAQAAPLVRLLDHTQLDIHTTGTNPPN